MYRNCTTDGRIHDIYTWEVPIIAIRRCFQMYSFFFAFHLLNMDDFVKPFRDGSVGKDQSCSGERKKKEKS